MKEQTPERKLLAVDGRDYFKRRYHDVWDEVLDLREKAIKIAEKLSAKEDEMKRLENLGAAAERVVQMEFPEIIQEENARLKLVEDANLIAKYA